MQIRLTVLAPHAGHGAGRACDVLVTAPPGTALAAVTSGLAAAVTGPDTPASGTVVLYAGGERLDARRCVLGEPPLVDGAVLSLQAPGPDDRVDTAVAARLHVVAGPDAGGVHLLHGGPIRIGRSVDADVPLDDPDVSRAHCTVTVGEDGRVTVADLGSTNGTTLDGVPVGPRPVRLRPGALLRLGESALRLTGPGEDPAGPETRATTPDGEGHLRLAPGPAGAPADPHGGSGPWPGPGGQAAPAAPPSAGATHGGARGIGLAEPYEDVPGHAREEGSSGDEAHGGRPAARPAARRGLGAWARRLAGGRDEPAPATAGSPPAGHAPDGRTGPDASGPLTAADTWPDPSAVLLTALGPGPRLWERDRHHTEALVVRLGTTDRAELSGVPVTIGLREAGSLGLAGPADRLAGLARSVAAQLAALHSPADLEIVLISADRNRSLEERRRAWGWLGWLPHVRPAHGQDCRLLLAYDREQAEARTAELTRRLDDGPLGPGWPSADHTAVAEAAARYDGPATVVVVDGDPGSSALRETVARLAGAGAAAGIHLICLAEAPSASPVSPVAATYETACAASLAFRECGAAVLLSGDVATALRLLRTAGGRVAGHGTVGVVDAVSVAWAERFGRALAPLRTDAAATTNGRAAALPPSARLLDELGLARATPASLMARWASAGEGTAVLGAGPRGPLSLDLTQEGPHLLIEGPPGSGRTELLRSIAASLAASARPDRLGLFLVDGAGGERGEGLAACTELPHVTEHLVASDPVRMREFAQALGAELKRRAELLGDGGFAERRTARAMVGQRGPSAAESVPQGARATVRVPDPTDLPDRPSGRTLRTGDGPIGSLPSPRHGDGPAGRAPTRDTDPVPGRRPYPAAAPLEGRASDRTPYPGTDQLSGRTGGRAPYPGTERADSRATARAPYTDDLDTRGSGRVGRPGDTDLGSHRTPYPGADDLDTRGSGRVGRPGDADLGSRPSGRTPYPGSDPVDSRPSGRTPYPATDHGDHRTDGRTPYPGADDLDTRGSGRMASPVGRDLGPRPGGGGHRAGDGTPPERVGGRTLRVGDDDVDGRAAGRGARGAVDGFLGETPSGRLPRRSGGLDAPSSGRTLRGGAGEPVIPRPAGPESPRTPQAQAQVQAPAPEQAQAPAGPLPRLVVLVDDFDALVAPALGAPGRPAAGSVVRALEAVARSGERLGVHLVVTSARPDRTADTELAHGARLRIVLDPPPAAPGPDVPAPGRGRLGHPDGRVTPFQTGRVTGRIPRTATLRPTVVPLEWERMGDPPARRPVRELGNGPTDLALLASALERAARSVEAAPVPPLTHA
ncbi:MULTISPECIES: FtsK/SpoIIIE domain-containing protein [unclassified Streptomyces]|uniref:FtsK/SpoIIIE domain-containing protein n=1 Tax=unclassified Streptomyces TaxID=2593676 RepID=UPI0036ACECC4